MNACVLARHQGSCFSVVRAPTGVWKSRELLSPAAGSEFVFIDTRSSDQLNAVRTVNLITLYVWVSVHFSREERKRSIQVLSLDGSS